MKQEWPETPFLGMRGGVLSFWDYGYRLFGVCEIRQCSTLRTEVVNNRASGAPSAMCPAMSILRYDDKKKNTQI